MLVIFDAENVKEKKFEKRKDKKAEKYGRQKKRLLTEIC